MGASGLAFETWDPRNRAVVGSPTFPFVIPSEAGDLRFSEPLLEMFSAAGRYETFPSHRESIHLSHIHGV